MGTLDASVLLEVEGPVDDYFSKEAATVLTNEIAWSDGDQEFADWAIRARERWASNLAGFARLEIAAMGPGSPPAVRLAAMSLAGQGEAIKWRAIAGRRARDLHALHDTYRIVEAAGIAREPVRVRLQGRRRRRPPKRCTCGRYFSTRCAPERCRGGKWSSSTTGCSSGAATSA